MHKINGNLLDRVLKLETTDRRLNLVIDGIKKQYSETEDSLYRETVAILNSRYSFSNEADEVDIRKFYRPGAVNRRRSRTVIMELGNIRDVEFILKVRWELPTGIFFKEDFPNEIDARRRSLRPIVKHANTPDKYKAKTKTYH